MKCELNISECFKFIQKRFTTVYILIFIFIYLTVNMNQNKKYYRKNTFLLIIFS